MFELDEVEIEQERLNRAAAQQATNTRTTAGFTKTLFRRRLRRQSQPPPPPPQRTMIECPKCHRGICLWCEHVWHDGKYDST